MDAVVNALAELAAEQKRVKTEMDKWQKIVSEGVTQRDKLNTEYQALSDAIRSLTVLITPEDTSEVPL